MYLSKLLHDVFVKVFTITIMMMTMKIMMMTMTIMMTKIMMMGLLPLCGVVRLD